MGAAMWMVTCLAPTCILRGTPYRLSMNHPVGCVTPCALGSIRRSDGAHRVTRPTRGILPLQPPFNENQAPNGRLNYGSGPGGTGASCDPPSVAVSLSSTRPVCPLRSFHLQLS